MKIKFKCEVCKTYYYWKVKTNKRRKATRLKELFKSNNSLIHHAFHEDVVQ